jgi:hypothetical protein
MTNNGIVNIHGKEYMTVARRVELAHEGQAIDGIETEVLSHDPVVIRATVTIKGKKYTGISSVSLDTNHSIERANPYEVAETSAVGRALGFAGYGVIESIASADEMNRVTSAPSESADESARNCAVCGEKAVEKSGTTKGGKSYHGIFCSTGDRSHTQWLWD